MARILEVNVKTGEAKIINKTLKIRPTLPIPKGTNHKKLVAVLKGAGIIANGSEVE